MRHIWLVPARIGCYYPRPTADQTLPSCAETRGQYFRIGTEYTQSLCLLVLAFSRNEEREVAAGFDGRK